MDLTTVALVSWNGHAINDNNPYAAIFPIDMPPLADVDIVDVQRAENSPAYATKSIKGKFLTLKISWASGSAGSAANIMQWFDSRDGEKHVLIIKEVISSKQWYLYAVTENMPQLKNTSIVVRLYVDEYLWRSVNEVSATWSVAASGSTKSIVNSGNAEAPLSFDIKPTTAKSGNYYLHRFPVRSYHENDAELPNNAIEITVDTAALVGDATKSNQLAGALNATDLTFSIDTAVGGGLMAGGGMLYVDTEQIKYTSIAAGVVTVPTNGRGWGGTTAASHLDNAVCKQSRCMANGYDLRLWNAGVELDRWLDAMNTSATKIWTEGLNYSAKIEMTLSGAITIGATAPMTINVKQTAANQALLKRLPPTGGLIEVISGTTPEVYVYSARDEINYTISIQSRAMRGTAAAAHSDGDMIRWRQFDLWLYCGYADAITPEVDTTKKPACDLSSTNANMVFSEFGNAAGTRPFSWRPALLENKGKKCAIYTGNRTAKADPITDAGASIKNYKSGSKWKAGSGQIVWKFLHPGLITSVEGSGEKRRLSTDYPTATIEKSVDAATWDEVASVVSPSAVNTWEAWTLASTALGSGYKAVRLNFDGSSKAGVANNQANFEANTMTVVITNPVATSLGTREDMYELNCAVKLQETGDILYLKWPMVVNETLYVDGADRTLTHQDGTNAYRAMSRNTKRQSWLNVPANGTYTLEYIETGAAGLTITPHYEERNL